MKIIKGYTQWLNEDTTTVTTNPGATAGTSGPGAKPEGYTLKSNGVAYKYPFADDKAHSMYAYWDATEGSVTDTGASKDQASMQAALKKIMPSQAAQPVVSNDPNNPGKKMFGRMILDSVEDALELHAKLGWKKAYSLEQMNAMQAAGDTNLEVTALKNMYSVLNDSDKLDRKGRVAEWNKNFPIIWKEQLTKAGLSNLATA